MCTWLAIETIDYFLRNGSSVFSCLMDMTKAFDLVKHSTLFKKLIQKGLPLIIVRLLIFQYMNQTANVRWNGKFSKSFPLSNGVKQGAVISPLLYCFYSNDLFKILRRNKVGCWVSGIYVGALGYADDTLLLSPTKEGLQNMLKVCEDYAEQHNLLFSTNEDPRRSKTKCLKYQKNQFEVTPVHLCGNNLPWVDSGKHLGNILENKIMVYKKI